MAEGRPESSTHPIEIWGWASIGLNVLLAGLNLAMAYASNSTAIAAEMIHNFVDLMASVAVLAGLKLSRRKSRAFPYGLHKLENVVAAGLALLIFMAAYELFREAVLATPRPLTVTPWILAGVAASAVVPLLFSLFEQRAARAANSPSLLADAREFRVHVLTSGVVLLALLAHTAGIHGPFERVAAVIVVLAVAKTGWELLSDAMRVLLDASLDRDTLASARRIIESVPAVVRVAHLMGHNAGRFRFLEASIEVRVLELQRADRIAQQVEVALREEIPFLERAVIDVRSAQRDVVRVAIPLDAPPGPVCNHFGTAPHFLLVDVKREDKEQVLRTVTANPFATGPKGRGLQVAHWLVEHGIDVLVTKDDISNKGPGHALREAGVLVLLAQETEIEAALAIGLQAATA